MKKNIAVLLTCHNRKDKTISCLSSLFEAQKPVSFELDTFLVDDGSTDGTAEAVMEKFPTINITKGNGNLYWAGGMRRAWEEALKAKRKFDFFLLLNDDVNLSENFLIRLDTAIKYTSNKTGEYDIYVSATQDPNTREINYGGKKIKNYIFRVNTKMVLPADTPISCDLANANILLIGKKVVDVIGIFDTKYIHSVADYDYTLTAKKRGFNIWVTSGIGGFCEDDHDNNWKFTKTSLKDRINYLYDPKGLTYKEYIYYVKKHFPFSLPYSFLMLWLKTLVPIFWNIKYIFIKKLNYHK